MEIPIGRKIYNIPCTDQEKDYVLSLARELNTRVNRVISNGNLKSGDDDVLMMAAMSILDELSELKKQAVTKQKQSNTSQDLFSNYESESKNSNNTTQQSTDNTPSESPKAAILAELETIANLLSKNG